MSTSALNVSLSSLNNCQLQYEEGRGKGKKNMERKEDYWHSWIIGGGREGHSEESAFFIQRLPCPSRARSGCSSLSRPLDCTANRS